MHSPVAANRARMVPSPNVRESLRGERVTPLVGEQAQLRGVAWLQSAWGIVCRPPRLPPLLIVEREEPGLRRAEGRLEEAVDDHRLQPSFAGLVGDTVFGEWLFA